MGMPRRASRKSLFLMAGLLVFGLTLFVAYQWNQPRVGDAVPRQLDEPAAGEPAAGDAALVCRSDHLPDAVRLADGEAVRSVSGFVVRMSTLDDDGGKGTLTLEEDTLAFNDFGDAARTGGKEAVAHAIQLRRDANSDKRCRQLFDVVFTDGRYPGRLHFAWFGESATHRLMVRTEDSKAVERVLEMRTARIVPGALGDHPQADRFHFEGLACDKDVPRGSEKAGTRLKRIVIRGSLAGGHLDLDPNYLGFDSTGNRMRSTLMGWKSLPVTFKPLGADPAKQGRRAFELVMEDPQARSYVLVLASTELGAHRLLIKEEGQVRQLVSLIDTERQNHLYWQPQLQTVPAEERQAIEQLRQLRGYRLRYFVGAGHVVSVHMLDGDIAQLDAILRSLTHLHELGFAEAELPPSGLTCLKEMKRLNALSFDQCDVSDEGLASVREARTLKRLIFFNGRGPTVAGLAHFAGLTEMEMFSLRNEGAPRNDPVLDDGLQHLTGMTKLQHLNLYGQRLTDAGLVHIGKLTSLEQLYVSGELTAAGLKHLEGLKNLKVINVYARIPQDALEAFRAKLPNLLR